jgi:hypothetical protein
MVIAVDCKSMLRHWGFESSQPHFSNTLNFYLNLVS